MIRLDRWHIIAGALCWLLAAAGVARAQVEVTDAWVRATVPGQKVAAGYLTLRSVRTAKLVGVKTAAARSAELHSMTHEGGVMKMRRLDALDLPAGVAVALEPGGNHLMLFDPRQPLVKGQTVALELVIEQDGKRLDIPVTAAVRAPGEEPDAHKHH
jgi:copper(I)-binding protein